MKLCKIVLTVSLLATSSTLLAQGPVPSGCPAPGEGRGGGRAPGGPADGARPVGAPQGEAGEAPGVPPKKRLLIWADTMNGVGQHESIGHAEAVIEELGYKSGLWSTYIRTDSAIIAKRPKQTTGEPASGGPSLCNVDAIFFLGHREINLTPEQRSDLLWFVHDAGKGFVAAHTGITAFMSWPEFNDLIGAQFDNHPWGQTTAHIIVTDPKFPGIQKFGNDFTMKDEWYQAKNFDLSKLHVLMKLDPSSVDMTKKGVVAADAPYPLAWSKAYGKGRVFYATFAHTDQSWDDPRVQDLYLNAIKWSLGLEDGDTSPNLATAK